MAILEGKWESKNEEDLADEVFNEFYPDGTFTMESVELGVHKEEGIFWFDEKYMYIKSITGNLCGDIVGVYEVRLSDQGNLVFMGWEDKFVVRWMSLTTSKWEKR